MNRFALLLRIAHCHQISSGFQLRQIDAYFSASGMAIEDSLAQYIVYRDIVLAD